MNHLQWKTRNDISPQGLPKVYVCSRPEDFESFFPAAADDILRIQNCALWYTDPAQKITDWDAHLDSLRQMNLFVLLVTEKLLTEPNDALEKEFHFAIQNCIPVLPLMQAPGLEALFNAKCGHLQTLSRHTADNTALRYDYKLEQYLHSALLDDALIQKVREAFDGYLFMSYRKKDRQHAQKLMELIHADDKYRDMAIWYDEFLTPGEDFDDEIRKALSAGAAFVLAVTPSLLEEGNYVMQQEYPAALTQGKPVLAVEMVSTDKAALSGKFQGLSDCVDPKNKEALDKALQASLSKVSLKKKQDAQHQYLMGLAYLNGIDVEIDYPYARKLLSDASEAGVIEATDQLVHIYSSGKGTPQDMQMSLYWQKKLIAQCRDAFAQAPSKADAANTLIAQLKWRGAGIRLMVELLALAELCYDRQDYQQALPLFTEILSVGEKLGEQSAEVCQIMSATLTYMGHLYSMFEDYDHAMFLYNQGYGHLCKALQFKSITVNNGELQVPREIDDTGRMLLSELCVYCCSIGDLFMQRANAERSMQHVRSAEKSFMELYDYLEHHALQNKYNGYQAQLATCYQRLGDVQRMYGKTEEACQLYHKAVTINEARFNASKITHDTEAPDDYALSCYFLGITLQDASAKHYLIQAASIWKFLSENLPDFPIYKERLEEVEPLIQEAIAKEASRRSQLPPALSAKIAQMQDILSGFLSTGSHSLFLHCNGSVSARGQNSHQQCQLSSWRYEKLMAVSAGEVTSWGLRENGTVIYQAGDGDQGLVHPRLAYKSDYNFPYSQEPSAQEMRERIRSWTHIIGIDAWGQGAALAGNGQVFSPFNTRPQKWGFAGQPCKQIVCKSTFVAGVTDKKTVIYDEARYGIGIKGVNFLMPAMQKWENIRAIDVGGTVCVGLKHDGTVVSYDSRVYRSGLAPLDGHKITPLERSERFFTDSWRNIIAVAAGANHVVGLQADGIVVACGKNDHGQCNVQDWRGIIAIAAQGNNTVGLREDGTVVACGDNQYGQCDVYGIRLFSSLQELESRIDQIYRIREDLKKRCPPMAPAPAPAPKPSAPAAPKAEAPKQAAPAAPKAEPQATSKPTPPPKPNVDPEKEKEKRQYLDNLLQAQNGSAKHMMYVAQALNNGKGVKYNAKEAEKWALKAAGYGNSDACLFLHDMYNHCLCRRFTEAVYWARRAAKAKEYKGFWHLFCHYKHGSGVKKNLLLAFYYKMRFKIAKWFYYHRRRRYW
jgi:TPR repeat protein/alpha-tubulin suppressor-like RCC1 family protein